MIQYLGTDLADITSVRDSEHHGIVGRSLRWEVQSSWKRAPGEGLELYLALALSGMCSFYLCDGWHDMSFSALLQFPHHDGLAPLKP